MPYFPAKGTSVVDGPFLPASTSSISSFLIIYLFILETMV